MEARQDNPFYEAGKKYNKLQSFAEKLAKAADQYPDTTFQIGQTPRLAAQTEQKDMNKYNASADIALYTCLISREIDDINEYFFMDFETEARNYIWNTSSKDDEQLWERYDKIQEAYDELRTEIEILDRALKRSPNSHPILDENQPNSLQPVNSALTPASD